ncbi:M36 family metallopeptidase [Streptomyces sp. NPDC002004]
MAASGSAPASAASSADGLRQVRVRTSLTGTHTWYQQTYRGLPVVDGYVARHASPTGKVSVDDGRRKVPATLSTTARVTAAQARSQGVRAAARLAPDSGGRGKRAAGQDTRGITVTSTRLAVQGGASPKLVWQVVTRGAAGSVRTLVDARAGGTVAVKQLADHAHAVNSRGTGLVFDPNPVVALGDQTLADRDDKDYRALAKAYRKVRLTDFTEKGVLEGKWARNLSLDPVSNRRHTFSFHRDKAGFEQVSAYYAITKAQRYFRDLGIKDANAEPQKYAADAIPDDNSFYDPETDQISFGTGGVDDAEDLEVVWHEYGHAVQDDQSPGFGATEEAGAIGEGFGDYLAVTMSLPTGRHYDPACVMDWDATAYTDAPHCLRRTDTKKTVADKTGEVHDDGEIWSAALWQINLALGRTKADRTILESQFYYRPDTSFTQAAQDVVHTARALYGRSAADKVTKIFTARGILPG